MSEWNEWRKKNPDIEINLQRVELFSMYLVGINLEQANLENTDFSGSNLSGAKLAYSNFDGVNFSYADLKNIDSSYVSLQNANLSFANLEDANLKNAHLEGANLYQANLKNAVLLETYFEDAYLSGTILNNANLGYAKLKKCTLWEVDLSSAQLWHANLEDASISGYENKSNLDGANFYAAIVNNKTIIQECTIDKKTNFTMVGLDSARIEPSLIPALKTNIRRIAWNKYYNEQGRSLWGKIKIAPMRLFWWLSDYGSNTARIFNAFLGVSIIFTFIYLAIVYLSPNPTVLSNLKITGNWWLNFMPAFCFAVSTMVTLGFGGINVTIQESAPWVTFFALFFVTLNLMIGYFILAVLVTRLGILFQSLAPEQKIKHEKDENTNED